MGLDSKLTFFLIRYMQSNGRGQHNLSVILVWPFMTWCTQKLLKEGYNHISFLELNLQAKGLVSVIYSYSTTVLLGSLYVSIGMKLQCKVSKF